MIIGITAARGSGGECIASYSIDFENQPLGNLDFYLTVGEWPSGADGNAGPDCTNQQWRVSYLAQNGN
jgi:hypothetical protein